MAMKTTSGAHGTAVRGRGAAGNPEGRFEQATRQAIDDGWAAPGGEPARPPTVITVERPRSVLSRHDSPDLHFAQSVNPYRGCEHGCIYCYARPSHAYLGLSPGLDFETRLFAKEGAAAMLRSEIAKAGYRCEPVNIGSNTDGYQPAERERRITRSLIALFHETSHPVAIVTKNALVERDLDLLAPMAAAGLAAVSVSVTTLDNGLARRLEPRASAPRRRLDAIARLAEAGVPVGVNVAPVIPFLTDHEVEAIVAAAAESGARWASWTLLRLPWEVKDLFREWLETHVPLKAAHVMSRVRAMRGGKDNDPRFGSRMTGEGLFADLLRRRMDKARRDHGLANGPPGLDTTRFVPPGAAGQGRLF